MLAIIDYRTEKETIESLSRYADDIFIFKSEGVTYNSICGHPDIFIYQDKDNLIIAPNAPEELFEFLDKYKINYKTGDGPAGHSLVDSTRYNCVCSESYFLHKKGYTDISIIEAVEDQTFIPLPQAYTRCSLIHLKHDIFITSDKGIEKELYKNNIECCYFDPSQIVIRDHSHGFIGGTAGVFRNKIFFNGNIDLHSDGEPLKEFIKSAEMEIITLGTHKLYDGGGIIFIED